MSYCGVKLVLVNDFHTRNYFSIFVDTVVLIVRGRGLLGVVLAVIYRTTLCSILVVII